MYTIAEILNIYPARLSNSDSPQLDCRLILQHVTGRSHAWLIAHDDSLPTEQQWQAFLQLFQQRANGVPIAYLTGEKEFWGMSLRVTPDVLIPRPDTETLVMAALDYASYLGVDKSLKILDLGVGSGAIALALASELPHANVTACDLSQGALDVAKQNACRLDIKNIDFILSDWFANIPPQTFDIIVSNPPYIDKNESHLLSDGVRYEPVNALIAAQKGLQDIALLINQAKNYMHNASRLLLEHGYNQAQQVREIFIQNKYDDVLQAYDLSGYVRVTSAKLR